MNELPFITKLVVPRLRADAMPRSRLLLRLQEGLEARLQVVHAGAGFGKTTLLSSFMHSLKLPVSWYTLDPSDGDPRVFFSYLLECLERTVPILSERFATLRRDGPALSSAPDVAVGQLITILQQSGLPKLILFLDDFHTIDDSPCAREIIAPLIERSPSALHVVMASRGLPKLASLPRLLARREAVLLREDDLRFDRDEARGVLEILLKRTLAEEEVDSIYAQTEGWPAGLVLTTIAGEPFALTGFREQDGGIDEFMITEILKSQSSELQDFMLRISIPEELTPDLAAYVTGRLDSAELLAQLERRNAFLSCVSHDTFRYHQLFRRVLCNTLRRRDSPLFRELNLKAGEYFRQKHIPEQAISHFMEGDAPQLAADVMETTAEPLIDQGHWHTVIRWLDLLPEETLASRPRLLMQRARCALYVGDPSHAVGFLNRAIQLFSGSGRIAEEVEALMIRSRAFRFQGSHQLSIKDGRSALRLGRQGGCSKDTLGSAHRHLGLAYAHSGRLLPARKHFQHAVKLLESSDERFEKGLSNAALAALYTELGELPQAIVYFQRAQQVWQELGNDGELAETMNNMAVLFRDLGELDTAHDLAQEAIARAQTSGYRRVEATALLTLGDVLLLKGEHRLAREMFQAALPLAREAKESQAVAYGTAALGQCYRLEGQIRTGTLLLEEAVRDAESRNQLYEQGVYWSSYGALISDKGDVGLAQDLLQRACTLLGATGSKREMAITYVRLANACFRDKKYAKAVNFVEQAASLCKAIGGSAFLLPEATLAPRLMQYLLQSQSVGGEVAQLARQLASSNSEPLPRQVTAPQEPLALAEPTTRIVEALAFGEGVVLMDDQRIPDEAWESARAKELFFYLVLCPNRLVRKEAIVSAIWPDVTVKQADGAFHSALHRARRATDPSILVFRQRSYMFNPAVTCKCDVSSFGQLLSEASRLPENSEPRFDKLRQAISLYQGPLLPWCYADWCEQLRQDLERKYIAALFNLGRFHMMQTEWANAAEFFQRVWEADPFMESAVVSLMKCQASLGDVGSAVDVYQRYRDMLEEEVGSAPSIAAEQVFRNLTTTLAS